MRHHSALRWVTERGGVVCVHSGAGPRHGKDEVPPFVMTQVDRESIILGEISQTGKATTHVVALTCGAEN